MSMGICVPAVCSLDDLNDFKPYMIKIFNGVIFNLFEDVKGFNTDATLTATHFYNKIECSRP